MPIPAPTTASSCGSCCSAGTIAGSRPGAVLLLPWAMTRSARTAVSAVWASEAFTDAPSTVNAATTATPIISADAVAAVRRGLRIALRRARRPARPRSTAIGAPITAAAGRATTGPSSTKPIRVTSVPRPTRAIEPPVTSSAAPAPVLTRPATARFTERRAAVDGDVAQRGERGDARRLDRRGDAGDERDADADDERGGDRRAGEQHAAGQLELVGEQRLQAGGDAVAGGQPDARGDRADDERLADHRAQHLAARGAERPQAAPIRGCAGRRRSTACCRC